MNDNARKWVQALRSGEYKQGTGVLHAERADGTHEFCCLGVACDLAVKDGVEMSIEREVDIERGGHTIFYDTDGGVLPRAVSNWLGLSDKHLAGNPNLPSEDLQSLSILNDQRGYGFEEIAYAIERDADYLFVADQA